MNNIIEKTENLLADTMTPVSVYLKIRDVFPNSLLLESTDFHHVENCHSFICMNPISEFIVENEEITTIINHNKQKHKIESKNTIAEALNKFTKENKPTGNCSKYNGIFGYNSYDSVKNFEKINITKGDAETAIPELYYAFYQYIIEFNHFNNTITIIENSSNDKSNIKNIPQLIQNSYTPTFPFFKIGDETTEMTDKEYISLIKSAKQHCNIGDVFQLVLSRKYSQKFKGDEFNVYRQLRSLNPSPYLFYFDYGSFKLMGSSPESQIEITDDIAYINPIAGTYPRTGNDIIDKEQAIKLSQDVKENAEHIMLVDLARNDLSKSSDSVKVQNYKEIHFYSHVIHIVSKVAGKISKTQNRIQMMIDTFPAGTLTGAPKVKAMQLIDKYEKSARGFYGGSIGFIGFNRNVNHAILIRSILSKNHTLHYRAGAGIVSQSVEINELNEVKNKLGAIRQAINNANKSTMKKTKNKVPVSF